MPSRPTANTDLVFAARAWEKDFPPMTRDQLAKKRDEFWDTRVEGRKEAWQAIRMSCEAEDDGTRLAILDSAGLTPFDMNRPDSCFCYDDAGIKYELPMYLLHSPSNLIDSSQASNQPAAAAASAASATPAAASGASSIPVDSSGAVAPSDEKAAVAAGSSSTDNTAAAPAASQPAVAVAPVDTTPTLKVKIRFSEGKDLDMNVKLTETVADLKKRVHAANGVAVSQQRFIYSGKRLDDRDTVTSAKIKAGTVVQVMVVH